MKKKFLIFLAIPILLIAGYMTLSNSVLGKSENNLVTKEIIAVCDQYLEGALPASDAYTEIKALDKTLNANYKNSLEEVQYKKISSRVQLLKAAVYEEDLEEVKRLRDMLLEYT